MSHHSTKILAKRLEHKSVHVHVFERKEEKLGEMKKWKIREKRERKDN